MNNDLALNRGLLTPDHELWVWFIDRLCGPDGCDYQEDGSWICKGSGTSGVHGKPESLPFSTKILEDFKRAGYGIDVEGTIDYFIENGGHCDCEVVLNIDPD